MSRLFFHTLLALMVLVGLIFLNTMGFLNPLLDWGRTGVDHFTKPFVVPLSKFENFLYLISRIRKLSQENEILNRQVEKLTADLAVLEKAKLENKFLREALGFQAEIKLASVAAEVVSWDPFYVTQKVTLNKGTKHGVIAGSAVIVAGGVLVGIISQALENSSQMELITSSGIAVNAEVIPGGATGIIRGEHGLGLTFDLVSQTEVIKAGDRIITSGLGGQFPKNLLIGEIGKIQSSESELFQRASVVPATNLKNLRFVFIEKK